MAFSRLVQRFDLDDVVRGVDPVLREFSHVVLVVFGDGLLHGGQEIVPAHPAWDAVMPLRIAAVTAKSALHPTSPAARNRPPWPQPRTAP